MKKQIRLTESELKNIIESSVKHIIKEYEWNGRTPEQDARAEKAASTPTSWKAHMLRAKHQYDNGKGFNDNLVNKANDTFHDKYGTRYDYNENNYNNGGGNSNTIRGGMLTRVGLDGGRYSFNQRDKKYNADRYHERTFGNFTPRNMSNYSDEDFQKGYVGTRFSGAKKNIWGNRMHASEQLRPDDELPQTRNQRYLPMSQSFKQKIQDIDNDMNDFYSGDYENRLNQKRQQMRNK